MQLFLLFKRPGPKLTELLNAVTWHEIDLNVDNDSTVQRFRPIIDNLQAALKTRFTATGNIEHLNWIGFLNLKSWPLRKRIGKVCCLL